MNFELNMLWAQKWSRFLEVISAHTCTVHVGGVVSIALQ